MSAYDRFSNELASFFRLLSFSPSSRAPSPPVSSPPSIATLRSLNAGKATHLEYFDADLAGAAGAKTVLDEIERRRDVGTRSIALAQNRLRDEGVAVLVRGLDALRRQGKGGEELRELNLSTNRFGDDGLLAIIESLLSRRDHGDPVLTHLYLTANALNVSDPLTRTLGAALSSPLSSLTCLSLTNNPIGSKNLISLLSQLRLSHSALTQLHLSVCELDATIVLPLSNWLEDPLGGGRTLQVLALNGNSISSLGVTRIQLALSRKEGKRNTSLVHFEAHATSLADSEAPQWESTIAEIQAEIDVVSKEIREDDLGLKEDERYQMATSRNKRYHVAVRRATLSLVSVARVCLAGEPRPGVEEGGFHFMRLPIELRVAILRCLPLVDDLPSIAASPSREGRTHQSPLTERQFLHILAYAGDRGTLLSEKRRVQAMGGDEDVLREWILRSVGCAAWDE